jgi:glycosyltransferase involved in cell wall biosynthesis
MSSEFPLVTAIMIFLNGEKYIADAIDSIVAQTYSNWELVLVDDGSTDGATAIAKDYAARHPDRIRYIDHPGHANLGMSASRNSGVLEGRGNFISFLDADDYWLPGRLAHFVDVARSFPDAGMIYGPTLYWYSWAEARGEKTPVEGQADFPGHLDLPTNKLLQPPMPLRQFLVTGGGCLPGICSLLIRRDAYDRIGGFEPSFRGLYEDQVFLSKMTATYPVVVIEEVLDYYRQHTESCCYRNIETGEYVPDDFHPSRGRYLRWLREYLRAIDLRDPVIKRELRRQLRPYSIPLYLPAYKAGRFVKRLVRRLLRIGARKSRQWLPRAARARLAKIRNVVEVRR